MTKSEGRREYDDSLWLDDRTSFVREESDSKRVYDLEERTARFGEAIIDFEKKVPREPVTERIITQLVGAGTIVCANYTQANDSVSKREFLKQIQPTNDESRSVFGIRISSFLRPSSFVLPHSLSFVIRHSSFS
jgi:hypothetical protein